MQVFRLRTSRRLALILALLHASALILAVLLAAKAGVPVWAPALALALLAASLFQCWRWARCERALELRVPELGDPVLICDGREEWLQILPGCLDFAGIWIVLRWKGRASGQSRSLCLMADSLEREAWRRLRIWLRWRLLSPDRPSA